MSKYLFVLDNGHGGMIDEKYVTSPGKMFVFPDGLTIYEGVFNRKVVQKLRNMLANAGIDYVTLVPEQEDVDLTRRVDRTNSLSRRKPAMLISIHGNAGGGNGFEVFTTKGETKADALAAVFCSTWEKLIPEFPVRKGPANTGPGKEANFYILKNTHIPAVLTENLFMDNRANCEFMLSESGQQQIAQVHFQSIQTILKEGLL